LINMILYLACMTACLFGFFFFADHTDSHSSFVYLQYTCLLLAFWMMLLAIAEFSSKRTPKISYGEAQSARRQKWEDQKAARKARRRF